MKNLLFFLALSLSVHLNAQSWKIVSQNNNNSANSAPENVWMSPNGSRLTVSAYDNASIEIDGELYPLKANYLRVYLEGDTSLNFNLLLQVNPKRGYNPINDDKDLIFISDSLLFIQAILDSGDNLLSYTSRSIEIVRSVVSIKTMQVKKLISDVSSLTNFNFNSYIFSNYAFRRDTVFGRSRIEVSSNTSDLFLLVFDSVLNPKYAFKTSFNNNVGIRNGVLFGQQAIKNSLLFTGSTSTSGGRVFDEHIDDADIIAITDTLGNKKKVFHAREASFPYLNYDGSNLYFTCECYPNISFVQNTPIPGFSIAKLDSNGTVKWTHRIPPDASVVQDSAFRTYIFGHQRSPQPLFGEVLGNQELYMAVIDTDGTLLHFEHDTNYFWPNTYFYKLLYSPKTGVNLFMSHIESFAMGNLQVNNDSSSQNMFLVRFSLLEPEDTSASSSSQEAKADGRLILYPNPASTILNLSYPQKIEALRVIDIQGKELITLNIAAVKQTSLDVSFLSPGNYILQALSNNRWVKKAFVVK